MAEVLCWRTGHMLELARAADWEHRSACAALAGNELISGQGGKLIPSMEAPSTSKAYRCADEKISRIQLWWATVCLELLYLPYKFGKECWNARNVYNWAGRRSDRVVAKKLRFKNHLLSWLLPNVSTTYENTMEYKKITIYVSGTTVGGEMKRQLRSREETVIVKKPNNS